MKKTLRNTFAIIMTVVAFAMTGCGGNDTTATNESAETTTATTVTTTVQAEPDVESTSSDEETTATTTTTAATETEPVETTTVETEPEPVETTTEDLGPAPDLECLANSHEISIDELPAEDKEMFEQFIKENNLKGRFYDHIDVTDDIPIVLFIPSDELLTNEDTKVTFYERNIWMFCTTNDADKYFSINFEDYYVSKTPLKYLLIREFIGKNLNDNPDFSGIFFFDAYSYPFLDGTPVFIPAE